MIKRDKETAVVYRQWDSVPSNAILLLLHGLGAHSGRWEFLAGFLKQNGITSYAIEFKGFGETKDFKGHIHTFATYFEDIRNLRDIIFKEHPGKKIFLLGESLGGLIGFLTAILKPGLFDGLICVSPAFKSKLKFSGFDYFKILSSSIYNPRKHFTIPFNSQMCTRDKNYQKIMNSDYREHRLVTSRFLLNTAVAQIRAVFLKEKLDTSTLFLVALKDSITNYRASVNCFKKLKVKNKTIIEYPGMCHSLSIDIGRKKVFEDILMWVKKQI